MEEVKKLKILRCFSNKDQFFFNRSRTVLLVLSDKGLYHVKLRSNKITELYSGNNPITAFPYSPDDKYLYFIIKKNYEMSYNTCFLYKFSLRTCRKLEELILPLEYCTHMIVEENKAIAYGMRYEKCTRSSWAFYFVADEIPSCVTCDLNGGNYSLEIDIDKDAYTRAVDQKPSYKQNFSEIAGVTIDAYQDSETEFWDDSIWIRVFDQKSFSAYIEDIPGERLLEYVGKPDDFERYSMVEYDDYGLLIGYTGFCEKE